MKFDLWMPTASPMTTAALLDAVAEGAEARGVGTIWVGEHVVLFEEYDEPLPYAEDGRIPAPSGSGLLEPMVTLTYLARARPRSGSARRCCSSPSATPSTRPRRSARSTGSRAGGSTSASASAGSRRNSTSSTCPGNAGVAGPTSTSRCSHALARRHLHLPRRGLRPPPCEMYPKPVQQPPPIHIGGETPPRCAGRARLGQGWHTFNRSPDELAVGLAALDDELAEVGRNRDELRITVCPYFNQLTPEWVERYAEAGADAVAALFFAFTPDDVARAFDDLEACREAAARVG